MKKILAALVFLVWLKAPAQDTTYFKSTAHFVQSEDTNYTEQDTVLFKLFTVDTVTTLLKVSKAGTKTYYVDEPYRAEIITGDTVTYFKMHSVLGKGTIAVALNGYINTIGIRENGGDVILYEIKKPEDVEVQK